MKKCECECGEIIPIINKRGERARYKHGHNKARLGIKFSPEVKGKLIIIGKKAAQERLGENSPVWKGENVGYAGLHIWVRKQLGNPTECSNNKSHEAKRFVWANISGEYKRDISDWHSLCTSCNFRDGIKVPSRFNV